MEAISEHLARPQALPVLFYCRPQMSDGHLGGGGGTPGGGGDTGRGSDAPRDISNQAPRGAPPILGAFPLHSGSAADTSAPPALVPPGGGLREAGSGRSAHAPSSSGPGPAAAATMLMPKKNRIAIYELLFKEGVMVAKKDVHMPKHPELVDKNVPNLHVMKAMQSLKSRGYVKEQFAWRHFYWYLTNEGIQYLRDYLHLPPEIVPATLRRSRPETGRPRPKGLEGERPARLTRGEADRDTYRRSAVPPGADKKAEAGAGAATEFQFRGGFGRGRGQPPQ
uniref:Plectin/eS10 N-terminal domain-containing protein n=1 Tax=Anas zonorhyncha TaxID=75864 RepID=A0A8B9ZM19_9AVES